MDLHKLIETIYEDVKNNKEGIIASYIPELNNVDHDAFGISIATVDGNILSMGDSKVDFTIQSISKPFTYAFALENIGAEIKNRVGVEPSGDDFNSIMKLDNLGRPMNPMVNPGAIAVASFIKAKYGEESFAELKEFMSNFAAKKLIMDQKCFNSEMEHAEKNRAITHLLKFNNVIDRKEENTLNLYTQMCSMKVNAEDLALMGATLANRGINPVSKKVCIDSKHLRGILSVMLTCGMYNYSGEWVYEVGVPAKSSVSGGVLLVVPGLMGIAVYSPRIDERGNSIRGIEFCKRFSSECSLHILETSTESV